MSIQPYSRSFQVTIAGILFLLCLWVTACDEVFDPYQPNDQYHYSIYGYLDATADTQWVRIMPVREDFTLDPDHPIDATVMLEHVESGHTVTMKDTLISYAHGVYAWNFWTDMEIRPEETYRLTATRTDGLLSRAQVRVPPDFPVPTVRMTENPRVVTIKGVEKLADAKVVYSGVEHTGGLFRVIFPHLEDSLHLETGGYQVFIDTRRHNLILDAISVPIRDRQIFIASAGPEYHNFGLIDEKIIALPEGISNIENGIGYLAGIVSKTIPFESCHDEETRQLIPCEPETPVW
ncbi:MAG: hypothetical protein WD355_09175 [Balneolaceae bacterium]